MSIGIVTDVEERVHDACGIENGGAIIEHQDVGDLERAPSAIAEKEADASGTNGGDGNGAICRVDGNAGTGVGDAVEHRRGRDHPKGGHGIDEG